MKINELLGEAVADTKDAIALSKAVIDYLWANDLTAPGTTINLSEIPNLPKMISQEGQTLINNPVFFLSSPISPCNQWPTYK